MKTKNNVQKNVLRSAAVVASFVLVSLTVTAQDFWKTVLANSSFNEIALAMSENSKKSNVQSSATGNNSANYIYENEYDAKLKVENWMTDNNYFKPVLINRVEKESSLKIEDWMLDESLFSVTGSSDSQLKVEAWMTNEEVWN